MDIPVEVIQTTDKSWELFGGSQKFAHLLG